MSKQKSIVTGKYRMTSMDMWDQDFVDAKVPGYIKFSKGGAGDFHFGHVQCDIDWRKTERDDNPAAEFSFDGIDEMEPTSRRGWVVFKDGTLEGQFMFHHGDESGFVAE